MDRLFHDLSQMSRSSSLAEIQTMDVGTSRAGQSFSWLQFTLDHRIFCKEA